MDGLHDMSEESDRLLALARKDYKKHTDPDRKQAAKLLLGMAKILKNDIPYPQK